MSERDIGLNWAEYALVETTIDMSGQGLGLVLKSILDSDHGLCVAFVAAAGPSSGRLYPGDIVFSVSLCVCFFVLCVLFCVLFCVFLCVLLCLRLCSRLIVTHARTRTHAHTRTHTHTCTHTHARARAHTQKHKVLTGLLGLNRGL